MSWISSWNLRGGWVGWLLLPLRDSIQHKHNSTTQPNVAIVAMNKAISWSSFIFENVLIDQSLKKPLRGGFSLIFTPVYDYLNNNILDNRIHRYYFCCLSFKNHYFSLLSVSAMIMFSFIRKLKHNIESMSKIYLDIYIKFKKILKRFENYQRLQNVSKL